MSLACGNRGAASVAQRCRENVVKTVSRLAENRSRISSVRGAAAAAAAAAKSYRMVKGLGIGRIRRENGVRGIVSRYKCLMWYWLVLDMCGEMTGK